MMAAQLVAAAVHAEDSLTPCLKRDMTARGPGYIYVCSSEKLYWIYVKVDPVAQTAMFDFLRGAAKPFFFAARFFGQPPEPKALPRRLSPRTLPVVLALASGDLQDVSYLCHVEWGRYVACAIDEAETPNVRTIDELAYMAENAPRPWGW